jgi:hypothetical protein
MDAITDGQSRIIGFGGGIRGTKTWGSLSALIALCKIFPGSRWAVVRKDLQRLRDTTLPSFEKLRQLTNGFVGPVNQQTWNATCKNGSVILFRGESIDRDPELLRFHGYEVNGFLNEEADELSERTFVKEIERAGTWIIPNREEQPPAYILNTFNPCPGWPRRRFYNPWKINQIRAPYAFIPSTAADNPYISDQQREAWKQMPEAEYKRFVMGDWDSLTGAYYDTLDAEVHLVDRDRLPVNLPPYWRYWASFDWGYRHWSVMCYWATDGDGTDWLLNSVWLRGLQDDELAKAYKEEAPHPGCLRQVFAGHDCWARPTHHGASGLSTNDVFGKAGIMMVKADIDPVNGGRAVNRAFKVRDGRSDTYIVRTPSNLKGFDQLSEIVPDEDDVRRPNKVDADANGVGGDDFADAVRHGQSSRMRPAVRPTQNIGAEMAGHDPHVLLRTENNKPARWIGPGDEGSEYGQNTGGYTDYMPEQI